MPLRTAVRQGYDVVPVYIYSEEDEQPWPLGAASKWWLHHSLQKLSIAYQEKGSRLIVRKGKVSTVLKKLIAETSACAVYYHKRVEPFARDLEKDLSHLLSLEAVEFCGFHDNLLFEPGSVLNGKNEPYQVYTPFYRACMKMPSVRPPIAEPDKLNKVPDEIVSLDIDELRLLPKIAWDKEFYSLWEPEKRAKERLKYFTANAAASYGSLRDYPSLDATSRLAPHLHFGEISPQQVWKAVDKGAGQDGASYLRQLIWREFTHHMLYHFPDTDLHPLRKEFAHFPWKKNAKWMHAWKKGLTGYPIVDAGMRQLWRLGWMHNRVRMIVGSFLVKDLLIPWQEGEKWFWDTLVDADLSNNAFGWQWVGGCGADAAPYFRIFNPVTQGRSLIPKESMSGPFYPSLKSCRTSGSINHGLLPKMFCVLQGSR
jgi:deoxyribodipyrimidine photo-lyase